MKNFFLGTSALAIIFLSSCGYNSTFEPWFDEDKPLYENDVKPSSTTINTETESQKAVTTEQITPKSEKTSISNPDDPKNEASINAQKTSEPENIKNINKPQGNSDNKINLTANTKNTKTLSITSQKYEQPSVSDYDAEPELEMIPDNQPLSTNNPKLNVEPRVKPKFEPLVNKQTPIAIAPSVSFIATYIPYENGSYNLDNKDTASIVEAIKLCNEYNCTLKIVTHTTKTNNNWQKLSEKRIKNITQKAIKSGMDSARIVIDDNNHDGNFTEIFIEY